MGNYLQILAILKQVEDGAGAGAVGVGAGGVVSVGHHRALAERAEVESVNNSALVDLTANELAVCCPNLSDLAHLLLLSLLLTVLLLYS